MLWGMFFVGSTLMFCSFSSVATLHNLYNRFHPHQLFTQLTNSSTNSFNQLFQPTLSTNSSTNSSPGTTADDDHVLDLDGLVLAYVDVQSALQAAQAERDYYANECADRMVRREVRQCMMAGQPTGAVGALRWDLVQGRVRTCTLV